MKEIEILCQYVKKENTEEVYNDFKYFVDDEFLETEYLYNLKEKLLFLIDNLSDYNYLLTLFYFKKKYDNLYLKILNEFLISEVSYNDTNLKKEYNYLEKYAIDLYYNYNESLLSRIFKLKDIEIHYIIYYIIDNIIEEDDNGLIDFINNITSKNNKIKFYNVIYDINNDFIYTENDLKTINSYVKYNNCYYKIIENEDKFLLIKNDKRTLYVNINRCMIIDEYEIRKCKINYFLNKNVK